MRYFATRHGHVGPREYYNDDVLYTHGDPPLTDFGKKQAMLVAKRLKEEAFSGVILSSPYLRALETAEIIADTLDTVIYPFAPMQEYMVSEERAASMRGLTLEEIKARIRHIAPDAALEYPWWVMKKEDRDDVLARLSAGMEHLPVKDRELLFVGHGASCGAWARYFGLSRRRATAYNCTLSLVDPDDPTAPRLVWDTAHLPYEMRTHNTRFNAEQVDAEYFAKPYEGEIELPEGCMDDHGERLLHIGDTHSDSYPYYRSLIGLVKPDILLHTGDMADEVKVGRIPGTEYEYLSKISVLLGIIRDSGVKRVIIVPGNNDLPEEIGRRLPQAEIYPTNTPIELLGKKCRIGHAVSSMVGEGEYYLYGHGLTGEHWKYEYNRMGQFCRFNVIWGPMLLTGDGSFYKLPLPFPFDPKPSKK